MLTAATVEAALANDGKGGSWLRDAKADGGARLQVTDAEKRWKECANELHAKVMF